MRTKILIISILIMIIPQIAYGAEVKDILQKRLSEYRIEYVTELPKFHADEDAVTIGFIAYDLKLIRVDSGLSGLLQDHVVTHETGHLLDSITPKGTKEYFYYSNKPEFKEIFEKEKTNLSEYAYDKYYADDIHEYFADSFALYMRRPQKTEELAPLTYKYIDDLYHSEIAEDNLSANNSN